MSKRGQNEGSIYQRKDKRWCAAITLPDGKRRYRYGKTRREVQVWLTQVLRERDQGRLRTGPDPTLADYLAAWLEQVKPSIRPGSYYAYALSVRVWLPHLGKLRLSQLTPQRISLALAAMQKTGRAAITVANDRTILGVALGQAERWNLIGRNPVPSVRAPRVARREMAVLDAAQLQQLFAASQGTRWHALWVLLATTGLREGEAAGLKWADIDWDRAEVRIQRAAVEEPGRGVVLAETKRPSSRRTVALAAGLLRVLRDHRARQEAERLYRAGWVEQGLVFPGLCGQLIHRATVERALRRHLAAANLPTIRVHDLRHSAASYLLSQGVHPKLVQEMLGHTSISMTLDTYSHVIPAMHQEIARRMDDLLR